MFRLDGVAKFYAGKAALGPLTLTIPARQTTALIGPSGCGKSTLLRLLMGLITPDAGAVSFDGTPVTPDTARAMRQRIGFALQDGGLFPHLSGRGNVALMARYLGWPTPKIDARIDELTELVRLPRELLDRRPQQLSGGQRQRVSLMRALMLDPAALLLDEPLGALDPLVRVELQRDLRDIARRLEKTVVIVTHDLAEAVYFADRIVLLKDGLIVQDGPPADLWHRPADEFVTRFVQAQRGPQVPDAVPA